MPTKTETIFKNSANLQLRGNTYDASHLDRFLSSNYGERSLGTNLTAQFEATLKKNATKGNEHTTPENSVNAGADGTVND